MGDRRVLSASRASGRSVEATLSSVESLSRKKQQTLVSFLSFSRQFVLPEMHGHLSYHGQKTLGRGKETQVGVLFCAQNLAVCGEFMGTIISLDLRIIGFSAAISGISSIYSSNQWRRAIAGIIADSSIARSHATPTRATRISVKGHDGSNRAICISHRRNGAVDIRPPLVGVASIGLLRQRRSV